MELVSLVSQYRVITVAGADAQSFLQAQLTCDLNALPADTGCTGGLLNPKGKVLAFGYLLPQPGHWLMLIHPEVAEQTMTHLSRYIIRAKVELGASALMAVGLHGQASSSTEENGGGFGQLSGSSQNLFRLPDGRQIGVSSTTAENADIALWRQLDLRAGLVTVDQRVHDRFIPQMLGLDVVGAVSFSKGCYPGQEIVARARHLGKVKRGLALVESASALQVGQELSDPDGKKAGEIIDALATGGGWLAHAVVNREVTQIRGIQRIQHFS